MKKASLMFNQYVDFEINISAAGDARYAVAVSGPGGDASGPLLLPASNSEFQALITRLPDGGSFTVADYCAAYRQSAERAARQHQIALIGEVGAGLDMFVRRPFVESALSMMRRPARLAGLGVLQDFLERGVKAFRKMQGAKEFLETIDRRERGILDAIFDGDDAPFWRCP